MRNERIASSWLDYVSQLQSALISVDCEVLDQITETLCRLYQRKGVLYVCGNGGSASIAEHFCCDHMKGISTAGNLFPKTISLSSNLSLITAIANDYSYENIYSYQISKLVTKDDAVCVISSSGSSINIVRAVEEAKKCSAITFGFVGFDGGAIVNQVDYSVHVRSNNYGIIEDVHQMLMHSIAQKLRSR